VHVRSRWRLPAIAVVAMLAFVACSKGQAHFDGNGISFDYPSNWHVIEGIQPAPSTSGPTRMQVGFDQNNAAVVVITHLSKPVTAQDFQQTEGALIQVIQQEKRLIHQRYSS